ncbi:hypothetical protein [Rhodococcus spongiicola]|uniref:Uncharacterized protein n=1 Tax=Rhodococcus spongiicola TaxID=2487352 RepID=A0A438B5U3_9NOCA|nr:hypothetical protein [Rhodococcus spongiicola]RVW06323.1 hypothetical protein EF834_02465 [Rhodococcus spongiicola]
MPGEENGSAAAAGTRQSPSSGRRRIDRARLDAVFGVILPEQTTDERSPDRAPSSDGGQDEWLRRQVPPHHG